jgi:hypothetical protein
MPNWNELPKHIKELYGETIEIDEYKSNGWLRAYYSMYRPRDMPVSKFFSLYEKIKEDYEDQTEI